MRVKFVIILLKNISLHLIVASNISYKVYPLENNFQYSKKSDYLNVTASPFYAFNDGSHPRETMNAINRAIDSASRSGEVVYLPAGIYAVGFYGDRITFGGIRLQPGVTLQGDSGKSIIKRVSINGQTEGLAVSINHESLSPSVSENNFIVRNLVVEGASDGRRSGLSPGTGSDGGVSLAGFDGKRNILNKILIENVIVRGTNKEAILVWFANEVKIRNCAVFNCNYDAYNPAGVVSLHMENNTADSVEYGIEYYGSRKTSDDASLYQSSSAIIRNNRIKNIYKAGIRIFGGDDVIIQNNYIGGNKEITIPTGQSDGIYIQPAHRALGNISILDNVISYSNYFGVSITSGKEKYSDSCQIIIKNNQITSSGVNAIQIFPKHSDGLLRLTIEENIIADWNRLSSSSSIEQAAIFIQNVNNFVIQKNKIKNSIVTTGNYHPVFAINTKGGLIVENDFTSVLGNAKVYASSKFNSFLRVFNNKGTKGYFDYNLNTIVIDK